MPSLPLFTGLRLRVDPWPDHLIDELGHDPRSAYVETYWLSVLGPSVCWLLRRMADELDRQPDGFELDLVDCAASLGLKFTGSRNAPFMRTLGRACQFRVARQVGPDAMQIRQRLPPLAHHQLRRLPLRLQEEHERWAAEQVATEQRQMHRARRLARALTDLGEGPLNTQGQLRRLDIAPAVARQATEWAIAQTSVADRPAAG